MLDPKLTSVLPRRMLAFVLDFGLVGLLTAFVARSQVETFPSDSSTWTAAQVNRIRDLAGPLSRQQDFGDTKYVIPGGGLLLVLLILSVLALIMFVLLPASSGWTPGKRLLGLRVVDLGGETPTMRQYLTRAAAGVIDILPGFIPGLLGFVLAGTSPYRQRLGDRVSGTLVIDAKKPLTVSLPEPSFASTQAVVPEPEPAVMVEAVIETLEPEPVVELPLEPALDLESPASTPNLIDVGTASSDIDFEFAPATPQGRTYRSDLFAASASPADSFAGSAAQAFSAGLGAELSDRNLPPAPMHRLDPTEWDPPRAEPAPVWSPTSGESEPAGSTKVDTPPAAETIDTEASDTEASDTERPDSATPEIAGAPNDASPGAELPRPEPTGVVAETNEAATVDPVWNEEWQAWLFWDHQQTRWLRHDLDNDVWVPLS